MKALVEHKGKQFLVKENLELKFPFLGGKEGDKFNIEKVLYVDDSKKKEFGNPYVKNLSVSCKILSHGRDKKVVVFKMKRRKGYQVKSGHHQNFTLIKVEKFNKTKSTTTKKTTEKSNTTAKTTKTKKKTTKKESK